MSSPEQREAARAAGLVSWFSSASGQKLHIVQGKWLELVAWGEGEKSGLPFRGMQDHCKITQLPGDTSTCEPGHCVCLQEKVW